MANSNATLTVNISFPLGSENPSLEFSTTCPFAAGQAGYVDVPAGTNSGVTFSIPFGTVASPTLVYVKNLSGNDMGVRLNAANSNEYQLPTNGQAIFNGSPAKAGASPLTAVTLVTTTSQVDDARIFYAVFGDPV